MPKERDRYRIVIIEDSPIVLAALVEIVKSDPQIELVATAVNGSKGIDEVLRHKPDLVSLDMMLPDIDGFEVVTRIMSRQPTPILILTSSIRPKWRRDAFHALTLGALDVMEKPDYQTLMDMNWRRGFCKHLKFIADLPVIPHVLESVRGRSEKFKKDRSPAEEKIPMPETPGIIAIVGSAGGPKAIVSLLKELRHGFPLPVPVVIAIHIGPNINSSFPSLLSEILQYPVLELHDGDVVAPEKVYVAPGGLHLELTEKYKVRIFSQLSGATYSPSLDYFLWSVARMHGGEGIGVILSGMGSDGAQGLLEIRNRGGLTLGQEPKSCVVYGMPKAAFDIGAVMKQETPEMIAQLLLQSMPERTKP
jgi:two-component system, chemotaxis family, protein-glutamate methylesterase/glutaminase